MIFDLHDLLNIVMNTNQALAEHVHGKEVVAAAIADGESYYGKRFTLMFIDSLNPYDALVEWHRQRMKAKPKVAILGSEK